MLNSKKLLQKILFISSAFVFLLNSNLSADCEGCEDCEFETCCEPVCAPPGPDFASYNPSTSWKMARNQFYIGPEIYYVNRKRAGGTKQDGVVYGIRIGYDYIKRCKIYFGIDGLYGFGRLCGHSGSGARIKSNFYDTQAEARLGYTFQQKCGYRFRFIPFAGGGYAEERNFFINPSPLHVHFRITYPYVCGGFLSQMSFAFRECYCVDHVDIGINFKTKYTLDGRNHVSHDPNFGSTSTPFKNEFQYRAELPFTVHAYNQGFVSFVPFYEYRHYGGQVGFPFDFLDTQLNIGGILVKFMYCY